MNRFAEKQRYGLNNSSVEQDPRIRSKCSTPKRTDYFKNNKQAQFYKVNTNLNNSTSMPNQRTQTKQVNIPDNDMRFHMGSSFLRGRQKIKHDNKNEFQKQMSKKVQSYNVVAGTLRQYFKQTRVKDKNKNKSEMLNTAIQIIKAYSRTQINTVSPAVNDLISSMLDTLPISKNKVKKRLSKSNKISISSLNIEGKQKIKDSSNNGYGKYFSFGKDRSEEQKNLKLEIEQLQTNLFDLKKQNEIFQRIRKQFQQMDEDDKQEYIRQLQQIVTSQQKLLEKLASRD